jgi:hypothetical protein
MSEFDAILLAGPTASGKSDLALALAEGAPIEIVSVDSSQVYRGFDIGSAKADAATRARVPHHLIDIRDPSEPYSAGEFVADAIAAIHDIRSRGRMQLPSCRLPIRSFGSESTSGRGRSAGPRCIQSSLRSTLRPLRVFIPMILSEFSALSRCSR